MKKIVFTLTLLALTAKIFACNAYTSPLVYTPSLVSPAHGATNQMPNALLDWTAVSGAVVYKIQIDTSSSFTNPAVYTSTLSATNAVNLLFNTKYYWRVKAFDASNDSSYWSTVYSLTVLNKILQISPKDSTVSCPLDTLLKWKGVSGCTFIDVQVDTTVSFNSPYLSSYSISGSLAQSKPQNLHFGNKFFWRIRCRHSLDTSAWSYDTTATYNDNWCFFTTDTIKLLSPVNNAIDQDPSVALQWSQVTGIIKQQYQIDTTNLFNSPKLKNGYVGYSNSNVLITSLATDTFDFGSKHYWRVRAISNLDTSQWSLVNSFNVISKVKLSSPSNNQLGISSTPTLIWSKIKDLTKYEIEIDLSQSFTSPKIYYPTNTTTFYKVTDSLLKNTKYYWRMKAFSKYDTSLWSNIWSFTVSPTGVGITEHSLNSANIVVYPNPAVGSAYVIIESAKTSEINLSVIDLLGKSVREMTFTATPGKNVKDLNIEGLSKGIYLIKVTDENGSYIHKLTIGK